MSLEEFFEGNDYEGSIGCNLIPHPGIQVFYSTLKLIRDRADVLDVFIVVTANDVEEWPFSDAIAVITKASAEDLMCWLAALEPDETYEVTDRKTYEPVDVPEGFSLLGAWWD